MDHQEEHQFFDKTVILLETKDSKILIFLVEYFCMQGSYVQDQVVRAP